VPNHVGFTAEISDFSLSESWLFRMAKFGLYAEEPETLQTKKQQRQFYGIFRPRRNKDVVVIAVPMRSAHAGVTNRRAWKDDFIWIKTEDA